MLFSLLQWKTTIHRKGTNAIELPLEKNNQIAVGKIAKEKNSASGEFIKGSLKSIGVRRGIKDYDKRRKEKSQNKCVEFFARNSGAQFKKNGVQFKKWNAKKSKSLKGK